MKRLILLSCVLLMGCGMYVIDKGGVRGFWVGPPPVPDTVWIAPTQSESGDVEGVPFLPMDTLKCDSFGWWERMPASINDTTIHRYRLVE